MLARAYAKHDVGWGRAVSTIRYATGVRPDDAAFAELERQLLAAQAEARPPADTTASAAP